MAIPLIGKPGWITQVYRLAAADGDSAALSENGKHTPIADCIDFDDCAADIAIAARSL
jgi:hypothetical protein